jgi:hypothetical protein
MCLKIEMPDDADTITPQGHLFTITLREEATRLGLPDLEDASDEQLLQIAHLLPADLREDAETDAPDLGCSTEEMLVGMIRYLLGLHRPEIS